MIDNLVFGAYPEWLELPLDAPADELVEDITRRFTSDPKPGDVKVQIAQVLAGMRGLLTEALEGRMAPFHLWALLPRGGTILSPDAYAYGAAAPIEPGATASDVVDSIIGDAELYQPAEVEELTTPLGTAHVVRARTYVSNDHGVSISEVTTVFWIRPDEGVAVILSSIPVDDLVLASDVSQAVIGLAETFAAEESQA